MAPKRIPAREGRGEHEEKKSRFISFCKHVTSEEEANAYLAGLRAQYRDASHRVYAYQIGPFHEIRRSSDAGEPAGTAGRPVLEAIIQNDLYDTAVMVVRYFGGTLLGAGGLVRAYSKGAQLAIADSGIAYLVEGRRLCLLVDYDQLGKLQNYLARENREIESIDYQNNAAVYCVVEVDAKATFMQALKDHFPSGLHIRELEDECWLVKDAEKES